MEHLEIQVWKLTTELAAVKNVITKDTGLTKETDLSEKEGRDRVMVTQDNPDNSTEGAPGGSNKAGDNSEVQTLSDENNDRVKLDNILTISEDNDNEAPGDSNGNEAPGGSNDDKENLKPKQKKRPWWKKSEAQPSPQPPPTQLCSQLEERPDIKITPAVEQQVTKNTTKLNSFIKMAEEWHNTLSDLSNTNQHLEERIISTMHN